MKAFRTIACVILSLSLFLFAIAQTNKPQKAAKTAEEKKAKEEIEKKALALVEEIVKELSALKLVENRILVQATLGDLLWERDEKRARIFFKQALDQLLEISDKSIHQIDPVKVYQNTMVNQARAQLRQQVVQMVARRDARLARDYLRSTRQNVRNPGALPPGLYDEAAVQEINLATQVVDTDPKESLEIAQEYLEKGFNQGLIPLLIQLRAKDSQLGDRLADAIVKKLRSASLTEDFTAASFALALLRSALHPVEGEGEADEPRAPKAATTSALDEKTIQELMSLVVNAALTRPASNPKKKDEDEDEDDPGEYLLMELESMIKDVEKYVPARASALKARIAEISDEEDPEEKKMGELESVIQNGSTDAMLEAAAKAPDGLRDNLYQQAAMKAFSEGNPDKAKQIISEYSSDPDQRDQMIAYFSQQEIWRAASAGKIEQTRQMLASIAPEQHSAILVQLAAVIVNKGDKKIAAQLLNEARDLIGGQASNFMELMTLLEIARLYGSVELVKSFEIIEPIVDHLNVLVEAAVILDGFEFNKHFKDGELLPHTSSVLSGMVRMCANNNGLLARRDFDRAKATADRFQRSDVRIIARLAIVQGTLSDEPESETPALFFRNSYQGPVH